MFCMDQLAREDIAAAAAAHRELGRDYDAAVAEGLIERIGAEIDRRIDARLAQTGSSRPPFTVPPSGPVAKQPVPGRPSFAAVVLALGSMGCGIGAGGTVLYAGHGGSVSFGQVLLVAIIWIIIGAVNVSYSRRH
ncbi:MAG: hypothetical protein ABJB47_24155 [Actinomycetota bacterium]